MRLASTVTLCPVKLDLQGQIKIDHTRVYHRDQIGGMYCILDCILKVVFHRTSFFIFGQIKYLVGKNTEYLAEYQIVGENQGGRHEAKKDFDLVKLFFLLKMLEMMHETDVYKLVLLSDPPFHQKSRNQVSENVNWRTAVQIVAANWPIAGFANCEELHHLTLVT